MPGAAMVSGDMVSPWINSSTMTWWSGRWCTILGPTPTAAAAMGIVIFIISIHGQKLGAGPRNAHKVGLAVNIHPVIFIGNAPGHRLDVQRFAPPGVNLLNNLLDGNGHG